MVPFDSQHVISFGYQLVQTDAGIRKEMTLNPTCHPPLGKRKEYGKRILNQLAWLFGNSRRLA